MKNINYFAFCLFGYVTVEFTGDYCERFLNVLAANNIVFRDIQKNGDKFKITLLKKDFRKLRKLRINCNVKIKILKKSGLPFFINKHKFRYGMVFGFVLFFLCLSFLSTRIWQIRISGNNIVPEAQIEKSLLDLGIKKGMSTKTINTDNLKLKFVLTEKNVAWSSFNKQGSVLEVNMTEFSDSVSENTPSNLVAEYDAIVKKIEVQSGTVNVKIGQTVAKGQLLISGIVDFGAGSNFVASNGKILAEVTKYEKVNVPKIQTKIQYTNKNCTKYVLEIMGLKVPLYLGKINEKYEKNITTKKIKLFGGEIPVIIYKISCKEKTENNVILSEEEALDFARKQITDSYNDKNCSEIIFIEETVKDYKDSYDYICKIKFSKDIAVKEEIYLENP